MGNWGDLWLLISKRSIDFLFDCSLAVGGATRLDGVVAPSTHWVETCSGVHLVHLISWIKLGWTISLRSIYEPSTVMQTLKSIYIINSHFYLTEISSIPSGTLWLAYRPHLILWHNFPLEILHHHRCIILLSWSHYTAFLSRHAPFNTTCSLWFPWVM